MGNAPNTTNERDSEVMASGQHNFYKQMTIPLVMQNGRYYSTKIYQDSGRYNSYFCKVSLGHSVEVGPIQDPRMYFEPTLELFEVTLNGPGRSKALQKVHAALKNRGLEHLIFFDDKDPRHVKKEVQVPPKP